MAERICGNCKHFKSCQGVDKNDTPEDMLCNDFEAGAGDGGKDIGDNVETETVEEKKEAPKKESQTSTTRRKAKPEEEPGDEIDPPTEEPEEGEDGPGAPPEDDNDTAGEDAGGGEDTGEEDPYAEADMSWNPMGADTMSQYRKPKSLRLKMVAEEKGLDITGMKPKEVHEALLAMAADERAALEAGAPEEEVEEMPEVPESEEKVSLKPEPEVEPAVDPRKVAAAEMPTAQYKMHPGNTGCQCGGNCGNPLTKPALIGMRAQLVEQRRQMDEQIAALDAIIPTL